MKTEQIFDDPSRLIKLTDVLAIIPVSKSTWWLGVKGGPLSDAGEDRNPHELLAVVRRSRPRPTRRVKKIRQGWFGQPWRLLLLLILAAIGGSIKFYFVLF